VNYRRLLEVLRAEIARSQRTKRPFAVLFVDMNGLKRINDKHGHLVGSRALCRLADTLRRSCRNTDTPARYGGDEFAIVLPETGDEGGRLVLRRVCDRLAADNDKPAVSVTGGVAVYPRDGESPTLLLRAADQVLYRAKSELAARRTAVKPETLKTGTLF
jgi:diguanylate cyclase (GGDEF)-like protein